MIRKGELITERMRLAVEIAKMSAELACVISQSRFPRGGVVGGTFQTVQPTGKDHKVVNVEVKDPAVLEKINESLKKFNWGGLK
jgi:hypothetical protein